MRVCLDPGHGGTAPGTSGNGIVEKEWALEFCDRLGHYLRAGGAEVVFTRTDDSNPALTRRARTAMAAKCDLFLSIHLNGFASTSANGCEALVSAVGSYKVNSGIIARELVQVCVNAGMRDRGVKLDNKSQHRSLTVLRKSAYDMPGVMLEVGFVSNVHDAKRLNDARWRETLASRLAQVIVS